MLSVGLISVLTDNSDYLFLSEITVTGGVKCQKKIKGALSAPL
jgi:hypothetical protein